MNTEATALSIEYKTLHYYFIGKTHILPKR